MGAVALSASPGGRAARVDAADQFGQARITASSPGGRPGWAAPARRSCYEPIILGLLIGRVARRGNPVAVYDFNRTVEEAFRAATTPGYTPPTSGLGGIATSIIALGSAWSAGVAAAIFGEASGGNSPPK